VFATPLDIANRACQQMGVRQIAAFTDDSVQAQEIGFNYDKLRRAELRRNIWQFAIRNAAIRPITTGMMLISPALWASTTTYTFGSIVVDSIGVAWQSKLQDNLNQAPGVIWSAWEVYCGPVVAQPFDTTGGTTYYSGELIFETPGDGSYSVYMSLSDGNGQDPRAPSGWDLTVQYIKDQVVQYYPAWAVGTTYAAGAGVSYNNISYISLAGSNTGNEPDISPSKWVVAPTTMAPTYYSSTTAYVIGQFVTYLGSNYVCIAATTGNLPTNASFWAAQSAGTYYASLIDFNLNNSPGSSPAPWQVGTSYSTGNTVAGSDGYIYSSVGNTNLGNNPTTTIGYWTNTNVLVPWTTTNPFGSANTAWLQLSVALKDLQIVYPIGSGPSYQSQTKNVYRLPANFLRQAPQDPKAGASSYLGAPSGISYTDWEFQGKYIVTRDTFPIMFRFVADVQDVSAFDDLFCEMLAARIGDETVERVSQQSQKRAVIMASYKEARAAAIMVNGIETGPVEPATDDYIQCRL
jgi:hypothetical protein